VVSREETETANAQISLSIILHFVQWCLRSTDHH